MDTKILNDAVEQVKAVATDVETLKTKLDGLSPEDYAATKKSLADVAEKMGMTETQLNALSEDIAETRKYLENDLGRSGAEDFRTALKDHCRAVYYKKRYGNVPATANVTKAAADYVTTTDASAGVFVPTILDSRIRDITEIHGDVFRRLAKVTLSPGKACDFPWESTLAAATWRPSQGATLTEDAGPVAFGKDTLRPVAVGDYFKFANELLESADLNIGDIFANQGLRNIVRKIEYAVLLGDDSASAYPHDGILVASSVNSQTTMATVTFPLINAFIGECVADYEGSFDMRENQLITTPAVINTMQGLAVGASELTGLRIWGDPVLGRQSMLEGYDLIASPFAISTTNRMIMSPLGKVILAWSGRFAVDFNPYGEGWTSLETWMRVYTHADYGLGNPDQHHKAVFTALS